MDRTWIEIGGLDRACLALATLFLTDLPGVLLSEGWVSVWGEIRDKLELGQLPCHSLCA